MQMFEYRQNFRRTSALVVITSFLLVFASLLAPAAAHAAPATVSDVTVSVAQDGSDPLLPQFDDSLNNLRVAANDIVRWTVRGNVTAAGDVTYLSTLPVGMEWDATSAAASVCNVAGSISADRRTLSCTRAAESGVETFQVSAWASAVANGSTVEATVSANGVTGSAPAVTVVAETRTELRVYSQNFNQATTFNGQPGASFYVIAHPGATLPDANVRGLQALSSPMSFSISVPANAVLMSSSLAVGQAGTLQVTQTAPGADLEVTITGANTSFRQSATSPAQPANYRVIPATPQFTIFIPNDPTLPPGVVTQVATQFKGFDPQGLDGASNFGSGYAPGQQPGATCPTTQAISSQLNCVVWNVDRTGGLRIISNYVGATHNLTGGLRYLMADNHAFPQGQEKIIPGGTFSAHQGFGNNSTASDSATTPFLCVTYNNELITLNGTPIPKRTGTPNLSVYTGGGTVLTPAEYTLEYSAQVYASDVERRGADCGVAGDGAAGWASNPADLPGGAASVTSIRLKSETLVLDPGVSLAMSIPFVRTTNAASLALPVNAAVPWFFQYGTDQTAVVRSSFPSAGTTIQRVDGGFIQAVPSLVRATTSTTDASIEPGTSTTLSVKPFIIAPVGQGVDTSAEDISLTLTLSTTCVTPVESTLAALVSAGKIESYALTQADPGPDGILCTSDDGQPASVVFQLGSAAALGGPTGLTAPGYTFFAGHQIDLETLAVGLVAAPLTPSGTTVRATTVIAASTDTSLALSTPNPTTDRTSESLVVVSGVASLTGYKSAVTAAGGLVGPGESFSYVLDWSNGTADRSGPGTFVDLLPFNGDGRGTSGLGGEGFTIESVSASMMNPDLMGNVVVEYTTDDAASVLSAINEPDNEDGHTGIAWQAGAVPGAGVTALRFVMASPLEPGFAGSATITARAPSLGVGGQLVNNLYGRTAAVDGDPATAKAFRGVSAVTLASTAASLSGTIFRDLDFSGDISGADDTWAAGSGIIEVVDVATGLVVVTTDIGATGNYFALVPAGEYTVRLIDDAHEGWAQVNPATTTVVAGDEVDGFDQLYAEVIADPVLADDDATTHLGDPVLIDVTANDTLSLPTVSEGAFPIDGVALGATSPSYGTVELAAPAGGSDQSQIRYTPPAVWPAEFEGEDSFQDTFTYDWTNALGVTRTATVTVTVYVSLVAVDDRAETLAGKPVDIPVLDNDSGASIAVTGLSALPKTTGTVEILEGGSLRFTPAPGFAGQARFDYTITDTTGLEATAEVLVTVWGTPQPPQLESTTHRDVPVDTEGWSISAEDAAPSFRYGATTVSVSNGANGTAELLEDGTMRYTPDLGFVGDDVVTFTVRDTAEQEATSTWVIHVLPVDTPLPPVPPEPPIPTPAPQPGNGLAWTGGALSISIGTAALALLTAGAGLLSRRRIS